MRNASLTATPQTPAIRLLQSLTTSPLPTAPTWMTLVPIAASAGLASSKSPAAPPTMIASVPSVARGVPPETGASMKRTPRSCAALATRCDTAGSMVDISTHSVPLRAAASTPPSPVYTDSTCGEEGSIVTTTSAVATASAALAAAVMPAAAAAFTASGLLSNAVTVKPFFTRFFAMGNPMVPTPMKPMRVMLCLPGTGARRPPIPR